MTWTRFIRVPLPRVQPAISSTYLPSTILSPFSPQPYCPLLYFPLLTVSPPLVASRWQTHSWMVDGQNKETQMWTIISLLARARRPRLSPGRSAGLWGRGLLMKPWDRPSGNDHTCVGVIRWRFAESRFDYRALNRGLWLAAGWRRCD